MDLVWLLEIAQEKLPGDPDVVDFGAREAARARHCAVVMGTTVYPEPHHRAAALLQSLVRLPALEHSNELYAAAVARPSSPPAAAPSRRAPSRPSTSSGRPRTEWTSATSPPP
ncbi:hypothetical protein ACIRQY_33625 [Streptomyces sp. NPDC101490]|uniref:hypothetical protein n=1 Tax=Streptomyces sp. NPDC101490 TaxID=3366143 RepID=UPI0037F64F34